MRNAEWRHGGAVSEMSDMDDMDEMDGMSEMDEMRNARGKPSAEAPIASP